MKRMIMAILLSALFISAGCGRTEPYLDTLSFSEETESVTETETEPAPEKQKETDTVYIYVCGAVNAPGVYALPSDSRIFEALSLAGGLTEEADMAAINQAEHVMGDDPRDRTAVTG